MKYFIVLRNRFKTNKNHDEKPDQPMDCQKEIYVFRKENHRRDQGLRRTLVAKAEMY
jgi:hypothetical protein